MGWVPFPWQRRRGNLLLRWSHGATGRSLLQIPPQRWLCWSGMGRRRSRVGKGLAESLAEQDNVRGAAAEG